MLVRVLSLVFVRLIYEKVADNNVIAKRGPASFAKQSLTTICTQRCKKNELKRQSQRLVKKQQQGSAKRYPYHPHRAINRNRGKNVLA